MPNLLILGHRGASSLAPENTLPAFNKAAQVGAQIELDLQMTKDGELIVIHDERLERTTTGKGFVGNYTLAHLRKLDAGRWFKPEFTGTVIPTLDEVFATLPKKVEINIELKTNVVAYPGIEAKLIEVIKKHWAQRRVLISSFNWNSLQTIHRLDPKLRIGLLFEQLTPELWIKARLLNAYSIHPAVSLVSPHLVWQAHCWGYRVYPWVVNNLARVLELKAMGVDGVFTDYPQIFARHEETDDSSN